MVILPFEWKHLFFTRTRMSNCQMVLLWQIKDKDKYKRKKTKKITQTKTKTITRKNRHKGKDTYRIDKDKDKDKDEDEAWGCREWSDRDNLGGIPHSQEIQMVLTIITPAAHPGKCTVHTVQVYTLFANTLFNYTNTHPRHTLTVQYPNYYIFSQPTPLSLNGIEKSTQKCPFTCLLAHCTQLTKIWSIALILWMGYWWWYHTNNIVMSSEMFCNEIPFV